jgi:hypothetical protein
MEEVIPKIHDATRPIVVVPLWGSTTNVLTLNLLKIAFSDIEYFLLTHGNDQNTPGSS